MKNDNNTDFGELIVTLFMIAAVFVAAAFIEIILLSPIVATLPNDLVLRGVTWGGGMASAVGVTLLLVYKLVGVKSVEQGKALWFGLFLEIAALAINGIAAFAVYRNISGEIVDLLKLLGPVNAVITVLAISLVIGMDPSRKIEFAEREWKLNWQRTLQDLRGKVLQSDDVFKVVWAATINEVIEEIEKTKGFRVGRDRIDALINATLRQPGDSPTARSEQSFNVRDLARHFASANGDQPKDNRPNPH